MNYLMHDFANKERKAFIDSISPLRKAEQTKYIVYWLAALVFGSKMPHEGRLA